MSEPRHAPSRDAPHRLIRASAGTGKTYQLATRYLSLLRLGAEPAQILATTFTRKAAGEILGRILNRLARALDDSGELRRLDADLQCEPLWQSHGRGGALTQHECGRMLGRVIDSLHRVNVSTLDSFFHRITRGFALELDVPLDPVLLDDRGAPAQQLRLDAIEAMLGEVAGGEHERDELETFIAMLREVQHDQLKRSVTQSIDTLVAELYEVYRDADDEALWSTLRTPGKLDDDALRDAIDAFAAMEDHLPRTKSSGKPRRHWSNAFAKAHAAAHNGQWDVFLTTGVVVKIVADEPRYDGVDIPEAWLDAYRPLIAHARATQLDTLKRQTRSTFELLARFDRHFTTQRQQRSVLLFSDLAHKLARTLPHLGPDIVSELYFRLDGQINHLLIDEFQDTSLNQWRVFEPMVEQITAPDAPDRSVFIVGDTKQSIYGWRGGCAELFDDVEQRLTPRGLHVDALNESYRSSPAVLEAVNHVFRSLPTNEALEADVEAAQRWARRFADHAAAARVADLSGHVTLTSSPEADSPAEEADADTDADTDAGGDGGGGSDAPVAHAHERFVAERIAALHRAAPHRSIGVLVRRNRTAATLLHELRRLEVEASGEGGHPVTDVPAVTAVLAALTLADHPGDRVAAFHVAHSPVGEMLELHDPTDHAGVRRASRRVRERLLVHGYAELLSDWVTHLAGSCDARGLSRLSRLIELAERYESDAADAAEPLRPGRFVDFAAATSVEEPTSAPVRVMTIHAAKGLEFDAVVLADLDATLNDRTLVLVDRHTPTGPVRAVYRNPEQKLRQAMPEVQRAYESHCQRQRFEDLCTLYVAMTRARQALHIYVRPRKRTKHGVGKLTKSLASVVREALRPASVDEDPAGGELLYNQGESAWMGPPPTDGHTERADYADRAGAPPAPEVLRLELDGADTEPRRSWLATSPSSLEAAGRVRGADLLDLRRGESLQRGSLIHAWFERVGFVDEEAGIPDDAALLAVAAECAPDLAPAEVEAHLAAFRRMLDQPAIRTALSRHDAHTLWRERRFVLRDGGRLMSGTFDRVAITRDAHGQPVAATLLDFKTDRVAGPEERDAIIERYAPQLAAYRTALGRLLDLDAAAVTARLVLLETGELIDPLAQALSHGT